MQTPFLSVVLNLGEAMTAQERQDLALIIEEVLEQRKQGIKNDRGEWISPLFPKLLYFLNEGLNVNPNDSYYYLTKLVAECEVKRMQPDIISEKKCREAKSGQVIANMGCHQIDTPIVMFDGTRKKVQDVQVGDYLMGDDNTPRRVLELVRGEGKMYQITQSQAEPYVVNEDHILSLVYRSSQPRHGYKDGDIVQVSVKDYLKLSKDFRSKLKGYKRGYDLPEKEYLIPPYILGLWLGDGTAHNGTFTVNENELKIADDIQAYAESIGMTTSRTYEPKKHTYCVRIRKTEDNNKPNKFLDALKELNLIDNKHIPDEYLLGSRQQRSDLLAGLINTDGWGRRDRGRCSVVLGNTNEDLINKAKIIADSLGYRTNIIVARDEQVMECGSDKKLCLCKPYYHLSIRKYNNPLLLEHKRPGTPGKRDFDTSTISITRVSDNDEYYGFNLDGNQLYLFNDCTVTHNCRSFLTPHWTEKIYYQNRGAAGCVDAELDSIKRFGLNAEFLDAPSENYLCKSITPLTLDAILKEILVHYDLPILQGSGCVKYIDIPAHLVVYNYLGNTGWIESIIWDKYVVTVKCREPKTYGRWNQGVVTINLPYIALEAKEKGVDFFKLLKERSELVRIALRTRHERVRQIRAENAPLLWMYGALSRLEAKDDLSSMLDDVEYTTISYGYVGLYETCMALIGESNTTAKGQELSKKILNFINDLLAKWKMEDHIPYSIYGTPEEQTTEKFAKALKRRFFEMGEVNGVTDHDYVTNSYHVNPAEKINAFDKLRIEGEFLQLSKGGAVSYVECSSDLDKNLAAVETLFRYMYDNILYSELNFTNEDYCDACGYHGELILDNTLNGKFLFHCPKCGCYDATKLHATRRLCGYLGEVANGISSSSPNANQGRLADIYARVKHI